MWTLLSTYATEGRCAEPLCHALPELHCQAPCGKAGTYPLVGCVLTRQPEYLAGIPEPAPVSQELGKDYALSLCMLFLMVFHAASVFV